jgi:hypothetical protein
MWLTKIISFLSTGMLDRALKYFSDKEKFRNDEQRLRADLLKEAIRSEIDTRKALSEQMRVEFEYRSTRWIRPAFAYPLAFYFAAIIVDSVFGFEWNVQAMPDTMLEWSYVIISFYFGGRTLEKIAKTWKPRR